MKETESKTALNRRDVLVGASTLAAALGLPSAAAASESPAQPRREREGSPGKPPYNIVFIIVDQQTHRLLGGPK